MASSLSEHFGSTQTQHSPKHAQKGCTQLDNISALNLLQHKILKGSFNCTELILRSYLLVLLQFAYERHN